MFDCEMPNLAIVGAGIGGCSAAYFASKYLPGVNVTIYDAQDRIGGRILTYNTDGLTLELGATFLNNFNKTLFNIINTEGLKITPIKERRDFVVWNGSEFIFRSNKLFFITLFKLLLKYRLSLARAFFLIRRVKNQVSNLYEEELKNPTVIGELFKSTGLDELYKKTFFETLTEKGISQVFIDEVLVPITRVIYSQNADLGGFAGVSSLIAVYSRTTYSLARGNSALPVHLLEACNAEVKMGHKVETIERTPEGTYKVYAGEEKVVFDSVIIATPLDLADIKFDGLSLHSWEHQHYQAVFKRTMRGILDPNYFGLKKSANIPAMILTTRDVNPITHYNIQKTIHNESLVTITSTEPIDSKTFNGIFKNSGVSVLEHCWKAAYPIFKPLTKLPPTILGKRLIYISAVEPVVTSMETSALSALNAVQMLAKEYR